MKRSQDQSINAKQFRAGKLSHRPAGRDTMLPDGRETSLANDGGKDLRQRNREAIESESERASPNKWKKIRGRASEIAMNQGNRSGEIEERHLRRAKRELLGLQTSADPDNPLA